MNNMSHITPIKYEIRVVDEDTDEVIYTNWAYSMESLEEKFYQIERAVENYEEKLEAEKVERDRELEEELV